MEEQKRINAPVPARLKVDNNGSKMVISWRWWRISHVLMILFCLAWDSFLVSFIVAFIQRGEWQWSNLAISLHLAVGIGLTYMTVTNILNHTRITVTRDVLTVKHGPMPWRGGNAKFMTSEIAQLYCESTGRRNSTPTCQLNAISKTDHRKLEIVRGIEGEGMALFLEQEIEQFLGIKDVPVTGEIPK